MKDDDAILSADQRYRYVLSRRVPSGLRYGPNLTSASPICLWVMVNPSTADATTNDHTIRKVIGYCQRWGFARFRVVNLYAYRTKDVALLSLHDPAHRATDRDHIRALDLPEEAPADIVGPDNDRNIIEQAAFASEIIVAWGSRDKMPPSAAKRIEHVLRLLRHETTGISGIADVLRPAHPKPIYCIGRTKGGDPLHPLTTPYSAQRVRFED